MRRSARVRTLLIAFAALAVMSAGSCSDKLTRIDAGIGPFNGRWDGSTWEGRGYAVLVNDTLWLFGQRNDSKYVYYEALSLRIPVQRIGTNPIEVREASLKKITGGDAGSSRGATGQVSLDQFDVGAGLVRGSLTLHSAEPDGTWRFENGQFLLPVYTSFNGLPSLY